MFYYKRRDVGVETHPAPYALSPMTCQEQTIPISIPGFEVIRALGSGGMGTVFLARQVSLDRLVAIKLLASLPAADAANSTARFRREAELMAKIQHPNIVTVHDFGSIDGRPYLVMEYVEGHDLRHLMVPGQPMAVDRIRELVRPLIVALNHLHANGVLHRDLKPENILLGDGIPPKVTDFGIAVREASVGALTRDDQWLGTYGYVAPEVQYRLGVDERADQFSVAVVVYELLTGQKPLGVFKPPSRFNRGLSPAVDSVLMRALQEDREDRYPTIVEFGDALDRALAMPVRVRSKSSAVGKGVLVAALVGLPALWLASAGGRDRHTPPPSTASANRMTNSLGMALVLVPSGSFTMGSLGQNPGAPADEFPAHTVRISHPFYLGEEEVTVGQFRAFVNATGYRTEAEASGKGGACFHFDRKEVIRDPSFTWRAPRPDGLPAANDEPVTQVTWNDAVAFCQWLSGQEKRTYRLPTEAEWEYACRAGESGRWSVGDDPAALDAYAWTYANSGGKTHPVGGKRPNRFGLRDMHGNVSEWCLDVYDSYPEAAVVDPVGPSSGRERVLRGGAWDWEDIARTRSSARLDSRPDYAYFTYGFRVCSPRMDLK
jgi:formylglycine-generating enzyme required for sulfatase activity